MLVGSTLLALISIYFFSPSFLFFFFSFFFFFLLLEYSASGDASENGSIAPFLAPLFTLHLVP